MKSCELLRGEKRPKEVVKQLGNREREVKKWGKDCEEMGKSSVRK